MTRSITGWLITLALAALAVATAAPQALAFTLGDAIYDCDYLSEAVYLGGGQLSPDGTKLYILTGSAPATIRYYTLATPWDLTTASYVATKTFTISGSNPPYGAYGHNLHISPDGTRLYFVIDWPGMTTSVVQHNFGTAWDVSTLSSTPSGQKTIGYTIPGGLEFSADGTKMYVSEIQNMSRPIYQWTLSTPWSVSSASASGYSFNIGGEAAGNLFWGALDFWFSSDGATMCAIGKHPNGSSTLQIKKYTLITPWRVSTASYASDSFSPSAQVNHSYTTDLIIGDSDTKLYLVSTAAPYGTLQYSLDGSGGRSPCPWSATTNAAGTVVTITFSRAMADPAGMHDQFSYKINGGGAQTFSAAALNADTKKIELTCSGTPIAYGNTVTVSYTAGTVAAADTVALDSFSDFAVTNAMPAPPTFSSATTNTAGSVITITFSKAMANPAGKHDQFTYQINGGATQAFSAAALNATTTKIDLTCAGTAIAAGNTVTVNYTAGTVVAADGGVLATFSGQAVSNIVPDPALTVVSAETNTAGNGIVVTFSRAMANPSGKHGQFVYKINGGSNQSFSAAALNADPTKINLTCSGTTIVYGNTVTLNYTQGTVVAADGLYLGSFTDQAVTNNVPQTYAVTYNGNGSTGGSAPSSQTKVHDVPLTLRTNTGSLVKTGSTFTGWNTQADGLGTHYDAGGTYTANAAVTMYAEWTLNTWPVTYDANGATAGTAPDAQTKVYNVALTLRTDTGGLEKTGYTLSGWNTAANGSGTNYAEGASYTTNAALSLYAKWTANDYMVFFDAAGGTYPTPASKIVTFGSLYGTLATTSLAGYTLDGWFTEPTGGDEITAESIVAVAADDTLYAQWTANEYTVTFEAMDGTTPVPQTKQVTYGQAYGALATTDREGYVFDGWFTAPGGGDQVTAESIVTVAADDTLYAQWTANDYMVFFDAAGGTNPTPASKIVTFGALYGTLATTSRTGYALAGWFDGPERGEVTAETVVTTAGDHTLYAHWTPNEYTVTFDAQGGSTPVPESKQVVFASSYQDLATTDRAGYSFDGWFTQAEGGDLITWESVVTTADDHTLYAQWTANEYTVTFDAQGGSDPDPETKQVTFGQQYGRLAATSRTGYEFVGWFTGGPERDEITSESIVTIAGDHSL
ncbi:MAG: InlB B-repeat-containing protein, partial [Candidatus Eisenbacteria bacterium]|nr:InlB B-repeat-containing protein [Candidatus Eisenbacteria bacterium]